MNILAFITREFWIEDADIRPVVGPLSLRDPVAQARLSALALEQDREATRQDDIRADYLRNSLRTVK